MSRVWAYLALLAACSFQARTGGVDDMADGGDVAIDASDDAGNADANAVDATSSDAITSALAVDAITSVQASYQPSLTAMHAVGAGAPRLLVVTLSVSYGGTTATMVRYGGTPLTRLGEQNVASDDARIEIWALRDPPAGTANVTINLDQGDLSIVVAGIVSFSGVNALVPYGPFLANTGTAGDPTVTVPSAPGEIVLDVMSWGGGGYGTAMAGAAQQQRWTRETGAMLAGGSTEPGAAVTTMSWTISDTPGPPNEHWAGGAIAILP